MPARPASGCVMTRHMQQLQGHRNNGVGCRSRYIEAACKLGCLRNTCSEYRLPSSWR
jgi:hypothetical protein